MAIRPFRTPRIDTRDIAGLYERYRPIVVGYLRGQGARDPEDLASEVFVGVVRNIDGFRGDEPEFRAWLLVIAQRRLIDQRRSHERRPTLIVEPDALIDLGTDRGDVESEAIENLATARVLAALEHLTEDQRTVVLLHSVGDLALAQIAQILGKSPEAVKSLHQRGLAAAARAMGTSTDWLIPGAG